MLSHTAGRTLADSGASLLQLGNCISLAVRVSIGPSKYHSSDTSQIRQHVLGHIPVVNIIVSVHHNATQSFLIIAFDITQKAYQRIETGAKEQYIPTEIEDLCWVTGESTVVRLKGEIELLAHQCKLSR